ncbi:ABC transporter ATP-binding protein [Shimia sp. MMG029]|uniref:ABC transporter ATP-binding protein n=1 Tax=Shimia sp. MMG029 TaxID=3021978 RepID=UPI0022FF198E|nr:ABC transporter ATP-binding protein [Shimia sp. MMG029]MDA5555580.1 ABC transporter ATP-binding protein [Shimia sp. MMG029]
MAKITLKNLRHSYYPDPKGPQDFALKEVDLDWQDGGAYALLGPSGCGKSTLLNIISGLLVPSEGQILFDGQDVTTLPPDQRNIAQVFQFPVIYDTMTVRDNLAFPLKNRGVDPAIIEKRVAEIAEMLEVTDMLDRKAAGLSPDNKQKISMGRGLVRDDVNVVMFDEPLTVIDPHLKWKLRTKLKELHQRVSQTMIYVTHDQTEALTFADQVVVMQLGEVVQIGTPEELFERPAHTFVGHFIGSPGMNVLPAEVKDGQAHFAGRPVALEGPIKAGASGKLEIGIRPEFVSLVDSSIASAIPGTVTRVADVGRHTVVEATVDGHKVAAIQNGPAPQKGDAVHLHFTPEHTRLYADGWIASEPAQKESAA